MESACVFCGSSNGERPAYARAAQALGAEVARRLMRLVYGGGKVGLMGALAVRRRAGGREASCALHGGDAQHRFRPVGFDEARGGHIERLASRHRIGTDLIRTPFERFLCTILDMNFAEGVLHDVRWIGLVCACGLSRSSDPSLMRSRASISSLNWSRPRLLPWPRLPSRPPRSPSRLPGPSS